MLLGYIVILDGPTMYASVLMWVGGHLFSIHLLCHIYPGVPHQCAALFSLGLLHYIHEGGKPISIHSVLIQ